MITPLMSPFPGGDVTTAPRGTMSLRRRTLSGDRGISPTNNYRAMPRGSIMYPFIPPQFMQSPIHMQHSQSVPQTHLLPSQADSPTSDVTMRSTRPAQAPVRIKMRNGLPRKRLSDLKVENMCALLEQLEGLSNKRVDDYQERLKENNITGQVRLHCML